MEQWMLSMALKKIQKMTAKERQAELRQLLLAMPRPWLLEAEQILTDILEQPAEPTLVKPALKFSLRFE